MTTIDLRSDTLTHPTPAMREAMANAEVGDDQYGEDPTVTKLEQLAARMVGKEAALYVPSGIMGNLSSLLTHCGRGDEVLVGDQCHVLWYESGGVSALGGISMREVSTNVDGTLPLDEVIEKIRPPRKGFPKTSALTIEQTHNRMGGAVLPLSYLQELHELAVTHGVKVHMDGARLFNAAVASKCSAAEIAATADTVQFCLSKALAAPVGSIVAGDAETIDRVRSNRHMLGGSMRQSGVIAAAGIVALESMVDGLAEDHRRASEIVSGLAGIDGVQIDYSGLRSNIVMLALDARMDKPKFIEHLKERGVLVSDVGGTRIRMVSHYEITDEHIPEVIEAVKTSVSRQVAGAANA